MGGAPLAGDIDYTPLIFEPRPVGAEWNLRHHRYVFAPRKIRYLFWHSLTDTGWFSHPMELMLFSSGYPAQVVVAFGLYRPRPTRWRRSRQGHQALALGGDHAGSDAVTGALAVGQHPARVLHVL